jgi:hypothetical protein
MASYHLVATWSAPALIFEELKVSAARATVHWFRLDLLPSHSPNAASNQCGVIP